MSTLKFFVKWYFRAITCTDKRELLKSIWLPIMAVVVSSVGLWYQWWSWASWLGSTSAEAWSNSLRYQGVLVFVVFLVLPFFARWLVVEVNEEDDSDKLGADESANSGEMRTYGDGGVATAEAESPDYLQGREFFKRFVSTIPAKSNSTGEGILSRLNSGMETFFGGSEGVQIFVLFAILGATLLIIADLMRGWTLALPFLAYGVYLYKDWARINVVQRIVRITIGVSCIVLIGGFWVGGRAVLSNPAVVLSSIENFTGLSWIDNTTPTSQPVPTEVPIEVIPFEPDHTLQNFNPVFTEGAKGELIQTVGFLNDGVNLVIEAEAQRQQRQAQVQENQVLVLNTTLLLGGMESETGISESVSVVRDWYANGVRRADGTREASSFEERVRAQEEQLRAEGANITVMLDAAKDIRNAYDAFERMLKNLQLNGADEVSNPDAAQAALDDFLVYRARLNTLLEQLEIPDRVVEFDQNFVRSFVENAQRKEVTVEQTATPNPNGEGESNPPLATIIATLQTPPPTSTPTPTNTPAPTPTSLPTPTPFPTSLPSPTPLPPNLAFPVATNAPERQQLPQGCVEINQQTGQPRLDIRVEGIIEPQYSSSGGYELDGWDSISIIGPGIVKVVKFAGVICGGYWVEAAHLIWAVDSLLPEMQIGGTYTLDWGENGQIQCVECG